MFPGNVRYTPSWCWLREKWKHLPFHPKLVHSIWVSAFYRKRRTTRIKYLGSRRDTIAWSPLVQKPDETRLPIGDGPSNFSPLSYKKILRSREIISKRVKQRQHHFRRGLCVYRMIPLRRLETSWMTYSRELVAERARHPAIYLMISSIKQHWRRIQSIRSPIPQLLLLRLH